LKRETHKEEKNIQKGGGRGRGRETRRFALLLKLARRRGLQVREESFWVCFFILDESI
jgi:hypothetical protein